MNRTEIRDSQIRELLEKVRKRNYGSYLRSLFLNRIRQFAGGSITFDFPVTALVGPNGSGKSTVLASAACVYPAADYKQFFFASIAGLEEAFDWDVEYELIDKKLSPHDALRGKASITGDGVALTLSSERVVRYFPVSRTVPPINSPLFMRRHLRGKSNSVRTHTEADIEFVRNEASKVLGKQLSSFKLLNVSFTKVNRKRIKKKKRKGLDWGRVLNEIQPLASDLAHSVEEFLLNTLPTMEEGVAGDGAVLFEDATIQRIQQLFVVDGQQKYSEFNFGSGEASVLRLIYEIEALPEQTLVLIEEIENGLHPLAVERLVDYFIAAAARRKIQVIFTTHSEYALNPLPSEAVWSTLSGRLIQGRLTVESLRALAGRIDKRLAVFVEDTFAERWVQAILREGLEERLEEVGVYYVGGDGEAVRIHSAHNQNPSIDFDSLCILDGDSRQKEDDAKGIFRLPGQSPELCVFDTVKCTLKENAAILTAACQRPLSCQQLVVDAVQSVAATNRDPHLLFAQIGVLIGLVSEDVVRGAFLSVWIQEQAEEVKRITEIVKSKL
jgi:energy-coupling factor transporter ATP-binding protein EcfA2